jgi:hypothetical protein
LEDSGQKERSQPGWYQEDAFRNSGCLGCKKKEATLAGGFLFS